jgi:hypothetical protein
MDENTIENVIKDIRENHHKIIDDWCKAYMAQLYQEGHEIKPGCFTLLEQAPTYEDGKFVSRHWFKYGTPDYPEYTNWVKCTDLMPEIGQYLAYDGLDVKECYWTGKYWQHCASWDFKAKYWMPLPAPPKEDE